MARYPDSFIAEVRERADLLEVVGRYVRLKKQGANWLGLCPFHNEKTPSFSVRPDQGFYKCFGCGVGGDVFDFIIKIKSINFFEAVGDVASSVGLTPPVGDHESVQHRQQREERQQLLDVVDKARLWFRQRLQTAEGDAARAYLQRRGLSTEMIERFGLGYAPSGWHNLLTHFGGGKNAEILLEKSGLVITKGDGRPGYDRFRDRIIFPIQDYQGHCIGFGGRLMVQGEPKYINSPETPLYRKGEVLYGMLQAQQAIQREGRVVVVEGYMDLIALANHGIDAVVATLGTAFTTFHMRQLWKRTRHVCFCFDGDVAGNKAAWRALEQVLSGLTADRHASFLFLPTGMDPDDVVQRERAEGFAQRVAEATSLTDFLLRELRQGLDLNSPEGRAAVVHRARPLLAKVADPLLRELYGERLGQCLGMTSRQVMGVPAPLPYPGGVSVQSVSVIPQRTMTTTQPNRTVTTGWQRSVVTASGRDFEQALLAILLRVPELVSDYEEELGRLELENPQLSSLLSALLDLGDVSAHSPAVMQTHYESGDEQGGFRWWRQLPATELVATAERILLAEEMRPQSPHEEFEGCLRNCQERHLRREIDETTRKIDTEPDNARYFAMLRDLMQELKRLQQRKCHPGSSLTTENRPA